MPEIKYIKCELHIVPEDELAVAEDLAAEDPDEESARKAIDANTKRDD